jgi:CDP-diacylglycerol--glycerol-3-phosphate 3-phosphatidyltransferase
MSGGVERARSGPGRPLDPVAAAAVPGVSVWNLANALTGVRFVLVPVFGWLLLAGDGRSLWRLSAAAAFVVAVITDRMDGEVARRRGLVTDLGKIADPIADKALIGTALVGLSLLGELTWWVTGVVLAREVAITALRFVVIRHGVMPAGRGGKAKTALQALAITLYLLPLPGHWQLIAVGMMAAAVALTVITGLDYLAKASRLVAGSERTRLQRAERAERGGRASVTTGTPAAKATPAATGTGTGTGIGTGTPAVTETGAETGIPAVTEVPAVTEMTSAAEPERRGRARPDGR